MNICPHIRVLLCCILPFNLLAQNVPNGSTIAAPTNVVSFPGAYPYGTKVNYVTVHNVQSPVTNPNDIATIGYGKDHAITAYSDGLGRTIQLVKRRQMVSQTDVVEPRYYDSFSREKIVPLTYSNSFDSSNTGTFKRNTFNDQVTYFSTLYPDEYAFYNKKVYDDNTLYRAVTEMQPGATKSGSDNGDTRTVKLSSASENIRKWQFNGFTSVPTSGSAWADNQLYVNEFTNEDGNRGRKYTDKDGKLVLSKIEVSPPAADNTHTGWQCTYFVYDEYSRLRQVITPKVIDNIAAANWVISSNVMAALCYSYNYDNKNRVVTKKLPGQSAINIIYDISDRPVLVQDGKLAASNQWLFTKYDGLGREILTGKFLNSTNLSMTNIQGQIDGATTNSFIAFIKNPINENTYTPTSTISDAEIYQINYFDVYSNTPVAYSGYNDPAVQNLIGGTNMITEVVSSEVRGMPTGNSERVMNGTQVTSQWLKNTSFYDTYGNVIQTQSTNYKSGLDTISMRYSFIGQLLSSMSSQSNPDAASITQVPNVRISKSYHYDDMGRPIGIAQKINDEAYWRTISTKSYDKLSRLSTKNLGGIAETQDYSYRIWGALEGINKNYFLSGTGSNFFGELVNYDYGFSTNSKTDAPAGMQWRLKGSPTTRRAYGYAYDAAGRLTAADYRQSENNASYSNAVEDYTAKNISYDGNGNLLTMDQWGTNIAFGGPIKMDQLTYTYQNGGMSNQPQKVDDAITQAYELGEFTEAAGTTTTDYNYDVNGNATTDSNKKINLIAYDYNDKPYEVDFANNRKIKFIYSASGSLLSKQIIDQNINPSTIVIDYLGGLQYRNDSLLTISHEEGRCRPIAVLDTNNNPQVTYEYDYFVKDHLGNVRSVLTEEIDNNQNILQYDPDIMVVTTTPVTYDPRIIYSPASLTSFTIGHREYLVTNELNNSMAEEATFENIPDTRDTKVNSLDSADVKETRLNAAEGKIIGPSMMLRVMAGDSLQISTATYYESQEWDTSAVTTPLEDVVSSLLTALSGGGPYSTLNLAGFEAGQGSTTINIGDNSSDILQSAIDALQSANTSDSTLPQAYLNYIFLDENMQEVAELSGRLQTETPDDWSALHVDALPITRNGYVIVYLSNESHINVHFDNLHITHYKGKLLEENHYYPYGLSIKKSAIVQAPNNNTLFSTQDLNHNEFADGTGLDWYDFDARQYDPQIGRWHSPDPLSELAHNWSPYRYAFDNPNLFSDNVGLFEGEPGDDEGGWEHDGSREGANTGGWDNDEHRNYAEYNSDDDRSEHYTWVSPSEAADRDDFDDPHDEDHDKDDLSGPGDDEHGVSENYLVADVYEPSYFRPLHPRGENQVSGSTAYFGTLPAGLVLGGAAWEALQAGTTSMVEGITAVIGGGVQAVGATSVGVVAAIVSVCIPSNWNQPKQEHDYSLPPFNPVILQAHGATTQSTGSFTKGGARAKRHEAGEVHGSLSSKKGNKPNRNKRKGAENRGGKKN